MALDENTSLAPVNQRVLGSSPRGGAKNKRAARKCGSFIYYPFGARSLP